MMMTSSRKTLNWVTKTRVIAVLVIVASWMLPFTGLAKGVQYFTVLDATQDDVILQEKGIGSQAKYRCSLASLECEKTKEDVILPRELKKEPHYYLAPRNDFAVVTTFIPNSAPKHTLYSIEEGRMHTVAQIPIMTDISRVRFNEDGTVLLVTQVDGTVVRYDTESQQITPVTVPVGASWITLSPDGKYAAYYIPATQSRGVRTFGVIDLMLNKTYSYDETTTYWDLLTEGTTLFAFSPDSSQLLYLSDRSNYPALYRVSLTSLATTGMGGTMLFPNQTYTVTDFIWKDADTILVTANKENPLSYVLYEYDSSTGSHTEVADDISYDNGMIRAGEKILFSRIDGTARLVFAYDVSDGSVSSFEIPRLSIGSTDEGEGVTAGDLQGVAIEPSDDSDTLLVWLHGGPYRQVSPIYHSYFGYAGYDWLLDRVADAGVGVLKLDYPGSQGYGRPFAESITGQVGGEDVAKTLEAIQKYAHAEGYEDIYLLGNSYGGYLALKALVDHPDEFKGAFSINGVTDWDVLTSNLQTSIFNVHFGGVRNATNSTLYDQASIIQNIDELDEHQVYLAHGTADMTVPYSQSRLLAEALEEADKDVTFITYKDEDHVYAKKKTFENLCTQVMKFVGERGACSL